MRINVAYWADEWFTKHVYVSLFSILINMKSEDNLHCYFLTETSNKYISIIKGLEKRFQNFKSDIIPINEANVDKIQTSWELWYLNSATYYRFCINLIEWIDKIIYLDSDIIINSDISELFQEDLDEKIVGVCSDLPGNYTSSNIGDLWLKKRMYFNAWMMVINLKKRKKYKVSERCMELLKKRIYKFNDQDVLNIVLQDDCKWLPGNYNVLRWYFPEDFGEFVYIGFDRDYYENATKHPKIIHYTWPWKPWKLLHTHPLRYIYWKVFWQSMSIWVIKNWWFLYECFTVFIHNIEDFLFSYDMQKTIREYFWSIKSRFDAFLNKKDYSF